MPTDCPRLNVVLERPLYRSLRRLARKEGASLSLKARDLIREGLEIQDDFYWEKKAEARARSFDPRTSLSHRQVWR